jgi:transcriptional regulator with XRE-family HTH domain
MREIRQARELFGAWVRVYRHASNLTEKQVGVSLGKTETSISRIELGKQNVKFDDIMRLAALLRVMPADFFKQTPPPRLPPYSKTPGSGLEYFKLRDAFPALCLAACA